MALYFVRYLDRTNLGIAKPDLSGFAAPYATGALDDLTGSSKAGMWAVGIIMGHGGGAGGRTARHPGSRHAGERYPRSQPTG